MNNNTQTTFKKRYENKKVGEAANLKRHREAIVRIAEHYESFLKQNKRKPSVNELKQLAKTDNRTIKKFFKDLRCQIIERAELKSEVSQKIQSEGSELYGLIDLPNSLDLREDLRSRNSTYNSPTSLEYRRKPEVVERSKPETHLQRICRLQGL